MLNHNNRHLQFLTIQVKEVDVWFTLDEHKTYLKKFCNKNVGNG